MPGSAFSRVIFAGLSILCAQQILCTQQTLADHRAENVDMLEVVVVTATREESSLANTAASVGMLDETTLEDINPTHSSELLNRIPGVNVVQLSSSSEGTATAIRQPVSYDPVYLYLENGVATRSAGFFNHNALYEMNVSSGNGIEIIKGPGSALYGSDAIGAVINLLSGRPPKEDELKVGVEAGEDGWRRAQLKAAKLLDAQGFTTRIELNEFDGWRDHTDSERQSLTSSWNSHITKDLSVNTVLGGTHIDYDTGGTGLQYNDFKNNPERAGNLIGFRKVGAWRVSSAFEQTLDNGTVSITPFLRHNTLEYLAHWVLNSGRSTAPSWCSSCPAVLDSQDAHVNNSGHDSIGVLVKHHADISDGIFVIYGIDLDYSRGKVEQTYITRTDTDPGDYWLAYQKEQLIYDYDVNFMSVSPYLHFESQLSDKLRVSAGLRYDDIRYDYDNHLSVDLDENAVHKRLPDQTIDLDHLSPKLSAIYQFTGNINGYAAYRHAFRIPSSEQLFRSGNNDASTDLDPITADSFELGLRGRLTDRINFDSAIYHMTKKDDIITVTQDSGARSNVNAGETIHYGIELGLDIQLTETLDANAAYTRVKHKFEDWSEAASKDYSGNDMPDAPENFANVRLNYHPGWLNGGRTELEWIHQGKHWIDEANTIDYDGYDLLNLRADYQASSALNLYLRVLNLTDKLYAETTSKWGPLYVPGRPRSLFIGCNYAF